MHIWRSWKNLGNPFLLMNENIRHSKVLEFMAENRLRQFGKPRIGKFAEQVRPDPLHCEINAWQNLLDILYHGAIDRHLFQEFIETLSGAVDLKFQMFPEAMMVLILRLQTLLTMMIQLF